LFPSGFRLQKVLKIHIFYWVGLLASCPTPNPEDQGASCPTPNPEDQGASCPTPNPEDQGASCPTPNPEDQGIPFSLGHHLDLSGMGGPYAG